MARRRRKIRLGAPQEAHERQIRIERDLAFGAMDSVTQAVARGRCDSALTSFKMGVHAQGAMFANVFALPGRDRQHYDSAYDKIGERVDEARDQIVACFLKRRR